MKIYKILMVINTRKKNNIVRDRYQEKIIIDNLEHAKEIYKEFKNEADYAFQFSRFFGSVSLFEPVIHNNGELAYFPEKDYIERIEK